MQPTDSYFPRLRLVSDRAFSDEEPSAIEEPSAAHKPSAAWLASNLSVK